VPVLLPGEVVSAEKVTYLRLAAGHGVHIQGPTDPTLATVRVVTTSRPLIENYVLTAAAARVAGS
jgi:arginine/lysine/ornithine decarboxylase